MTRTSPTAARTVTAATVASALAVSMVAVATPASADPGGTSSDHSYVALRSQGSGYDKDQVLMVDGKPFWYNGIQLRADKLLTQIGYSADVPIEEHDPSNPDKRSLEQIFKQVAEDGYNTVNVQVLWSDLQKDKVTTPGQAQSATISADGTAADTESFETGWVAGDPSAQQLGYVKFDIPEEVDNVDGSRIRLYVNSFDERQTEFGVTKGMYYSHSLKVYGVPEAPDADGLTWDGAGLADITYDGTDLLLDGGEPVEPVSVLPNWDPVKRTYFYDLDVTDYVADAKDGDEDSVGFLVASSTPASRPDKAAVAAEVISFETADSTLDDSDTNTTYLKQPLRPRLFFSDGSMENIDWAYYDKLVKYSEKYGLKFEVVWFGSDSTGWASDYRVPFYVFHNYQMTTVDQDPTMVLYNGGIGTPLFQKKVGEPNSLYTFLGDRADVALMHKEGDILEAIMDHSATITNDAGENIGHTVIGVQTQNEPHNGSLNGTPIKGMNNSDGLATASISRSPISLAQRDLWRTVGDADHGGYMVTSDSEFRKYQTWYYNDYLGKRVKQSTLPVWTRVNHEQGAPTYLVDVNEAMRSNPAVGTYLDFVGIDTYGVGVGDMYKIGNGQHWFNIDKGDNIPVVMEDGMNTTNIAEKKFATVAGGAVHNGYNACSFDGDALYDSFTTVDACGRTDRPADSRATAGTSSMSFNQKIDRVALVNKMYNKVGYDLATRNTDAVGGRTLKYFNPTGATAAGATVTQSIRSLDIGYAVVNDPTGFNTPSRGFAIERSASELALGTTETTTFRLPGLAGTVSSVELGTYDADANDVVLGNDNGVTDNTWTKLGNAVTTIQGADLIVTVPAGDVARVLTSSPIPPATNHKIEAESIVDYILPAGTARETWNDGASGGAWVKLGASGMTALPVGAKVTLRFDLPDGQSDTQLVTGFRRGTDRATVQLSVNGTAYGSPVSLRGAAGFAETTPTETAVFQAGTNEIQLEVTEAGIIGLDYFRLVYAPAFPDAPTKVIIDEDFATPQAAPAFGFSRDAVVADGVLKLTNALGNEQTAIKQFEEDVASRSLVDASFDWVYNGNPETKGGIEFRDADGHLVFAVQGSLKNSGDNQLRFSTTGVVSDSSSAVIGLEPVWQNVPLTKGKAYHVRFQADFEAGTVSYRILDGATVLVQRLDQPTTATNLARMVATSAYRGSTTNAQSVDNLVLLGNEDEPGASISAELAATTRCVAGKVVLAVSVTNTGEEAITATVTSAYGSKQWDLAAGRGASAAFSTRATSIAAGEVQVALTSGEVQEDRSVAFDGRNCG
ncbi:MAG TPA: DUF4978 domain-containing protein [Arachnia sp.]|nr:DUF4978 domain-containing protein [Arachnia sp.]HMT86031.1 DUF4978 domain-containing protein [Arachnia sp.]